MPVFFHIIGGNTDGFVVSISVDALHDQVAIVPP